MSSPDKIIGSLSDALISGKFVWLINEFTNEILETDGYLDSPTFYFSHCTWYLRMYPKGYSGWDRLWISLFLNKKEPQPKKHVQFSCSMAFQGKELITKDTSSYSEESKTGKGWYRYLKRKPVLDRLSMKTEDRSQLTIMVKIRDDVPCKEDTLRMEEVKVLSQNYKDLLLHDENHDLTLKVKDKEYKVHRNIMQFRCPVFKSMLTHEMLERNSGVVEIPDCDPLAFEQFIFYVYCGDLETLNESVMLGLYYIADKYDMARLKEVCREYIKKSLSVHNVSDVIRLALNHSDSSLKKFAVKYFIDHVREILVTTEWQSFITENPIQANKIFIKTINNYVPEKKTGTEVKQAKC